MDNQKPTEEVIASGTSPIVDPTATKEVKFAGNLFQDFKVGSVISSQPTGVSILDGAKKPSQDYVANGNKSKNQVYTEEQLKAELAQKK